MKVNGKELDSTNFSMERCIVPRYGREPLSLMVCALPLNWVDVQMHYLSAPMPPRKKMKEDGKLVLDSQRKPIYYTDSNDREYQKASVLHSKRVNAFMLYEALRNDREVSFNSKKPSGVDSMQAQVEEVEGWLDALNTELGRAGITVGDISIIITHAEKLGNMLPKEIEKAREDFLSQQNQEKDGESPEESPEDPSNI